MGHIARLTRYALKHKRHFIGFMSIASVATLFNLFTPLVLRDIVDQVTSGANFQTAIFSIFLYLSLFGFYCFFDFIQRYLSALMAQHVIYDLRTELYQSLLEKDLAFYDRNETGQILARVTTDVTTMRQFLLWGYRVIFIGAASLIGTYYVMWLINVQLTLLLLPILPALLLIIYIFAKKVRPVFFSARTQYGTLSAVLQENIVGMRVVQSYVSMDRERERVRKENERYLGLVVDAFRLSAFYSPLLIAVLGIGTGVLIYMGGVQFSAGVLSYGEFVGFVSLVGMLLLPARFLSWGIGLYQRASAAAERTFYILDAREEIMDPEDPAEISDIRGEVEFKNVYFSHGGENWVLKDVSFKVQPGQVVALLGRTGSGKTSVVNLIPRFYDVDSRRVVEYNGKVYALDNKGHVKIDGTTYHEHDGFIVVNGEELQVQDPGHIEIDGVDIRFYKISELREQIGMVHQDPFLFSASIKENIAFARPYATDEEIENAARAAMIHDFIMTLDQGYDTEVGERGVTLSGGQKQRIAIARALLADPRILILDDSTSSVDANTELQIQRALENLMRGRTTFIITHRLSTIRNADIIIMMDRGRIVEMGNHSELIEKEGMYASLFQTLSRMAAIALEETGGRVS